MSSSEAWAVVAAKRARKVIARAPRHEREQLQAALDEMGLDPFTGDIQRLKDERAAFRRRHRQDNLLRLDRRRPRVWAEREAYNAVTGGKRGKQGRRR